jgi:sulfonate transport system substrate-binding protein
MMRKNVKGFIAGILVLLVLAVTAQSNVISTALAGEIEAGRADTKKDYDGLVINVSESSVILFTGLVAHLKGFFDEEFAGEGITFKFDTYVNGPAAIEGFASGVVDVGTWGDQPIIAGFANGIDIKILAPYGDIAGQQELVANKGSSIEKAADIKGKKVAVSAGTTTELNLRIIIEKLGYTENDVELVFMPSADIISALLSGHVDAAVLMDPQSTKAIEQGCVLVDYVSKYTKAINVTVMRGEFYKKYPEIAVRILKLYDRTNKWIAENQEETAKIISAHMDLDYEQTLNTLKHVELSVTFKPGYLEAIDRTAKFLYDNGILGKRVTTNDFVDFTYLEKAGLK